MRVLVTGSTGKVGGAVVRAAHAAGHEVRASARDVERGRALLPPDVEVVGGDVTDPDSLASACRGREVVFNAMGIPEQWLADPSLFDRVNVDGSVNVARAASEAGARRLVHTSTIDVFDAPPGGRFDESHLASAPKHTAYERSKQRAEQAVLAAVAAVAASAPASASASLPLPVPGSGASSGSRMDVVFANAATVYGPGPTGPASMETQLFRPAMRGLLPAVPPGGFGVVFTEGLAQGHLLAAERGRPGERYIFCDEHATLMELARAVVAVTGRGRPPFMTIPRAVASVMATTGEAVARVTRRAPPISRGQLLYLLWNAAPDSTRARTELGWRPTPLSDGIRRTMVEGASTRT